MKTLFTKPEKLFLQESDLIKERKGEKKNALIQYEQKGEEFLLHHFDEQKTPVNS